MTQFRNSPFLNIELHDRDERVNSRRRTGSVFGSENADESLGRVSGKMDLLKTKNEPEWYPHGCVRLDLSELWLGQTSLEFYVPVVPCHANEAASGVSRSSFGSVLQRIALSLRSKQNGQTNIISQAFINSAGRFSFHRNANESARQIGSAASSTDRESTVVRSTRLNPDERKCSATRRKAKRRISFD